MGNVVLTGGCSLFSGFADRLDNELSRNFSHVRQFIYLQYRRHIFWQVKIHAPGNPIERKYGGWLGGSILASLGTFHQLWISKEEWQVRHLILYHHLRSIYSPRSTESPSWASDVNRPCLVSPMFVAFVSTNYRAWKVE